MLVTSFTFELSFKQSKKINNAVSEAMVNGSSPNVSNLNIGKDIPSFISDINNEMILNNYFRERFGNSIIDSMFTWSYELKPDAQLYLNEYGIINDGF